jgi:glucosamine-6-phosphate deaminase
VEVVIVPDEAHGGELGARAVERLLDQRPHAVLGLATGSSPLPVYRELIRRHRAGRVSFARCRAFLLDEYVGLRSDHPASYRSFILRELADHVDFEPGAVCGPDGTADDLALACARYEAALAEAGGVDLQMLGIGSDGHIGFNEPSSSLGSRTRLKTLTDQTRRDNARFFETPDEVPRHVITQGVRTILEAGHLLLLAFGESKADAVARALEGPLTAMVPASALQLHPHATVIVDEAAAKGLELAPYHRETWLGKPPWQDL